MILEEGLHLLCKKLVLGADDHTLLDAPEGYIVLTVTKVSENQVHHTKIYNVWYVNHMPVVIDDSSSKDSFGTPLENDKLKTR